jgi:hypothetical protein
MAKQAVISEEPAGATVLAGHGFGATDSAGQ